MHGWVASNRSVSVICPSPPRIHDWLRSKKRAAVVQRRKSDYIILLGPARNRQPHGSSLMRTRIKHCSVLSPWRYISVDHMSAHYEALMSLERALGGATQGTITFSSVKAKAAIQLSSINRALIMSVITCNVITLSHICQAPQCRFYSI